MRAVITINNISNTITVSRIIFAVTLLFVKPLSLLFFSIYIFCGLSDVADGYIARKSKSETRAGATLDSIADAVFIGVLLIIFLPIFNLPTGILIWIASIASVRILSLIIGFYKYRAFAFLHTYANKITGVILFSFPLLYNAVGLMGTAYFICSIASISAVEELLINSVSKKLSRDIKCIFAK